MIGTAAAPTTHHPGTARAALRDSTREQHERLHRHPIFTSLLAGALPRAGYERLLAALFRYHGSSAGLLASAHRTLGIPALDAVHHGRLARLGADLAGLGGCAIEEEPVRGEGAWACGYAYVVHGSALGGRVIGRALARHDQPHFGHASFFAAPLPPELWSRLCAGLATADLAQATDGAAASFARFERLLEAV